jgi:hypothetical protein
MYFSMQKFIFQGCLVMEPDSRLTCAELLEHKYFDGFRERFEPELQAMVSKSQDQHQTKPKKQKVGHCEPKLKFLACPNS